MRPPPTAEPVLIRAAPLVGALVGLTITVLDFTTFKLLDISMIANGQDVFWPVLLFFGLSYAAFGATVGALLLHRARLRRSHAVIAAQLQALEEQQERLVQAEQLARVGRLAASVAHEVRNPLGVIRSSAALVAEELSAGSAEHEALQFIVDEVDRLNAFTTRLLDLSRPLAPNLQPTNLRDALHDALHLASAELDARQVQAEIVAAPDATTLADPDLLARAIAILLVNAAQAVHAGGHVCVEAQQNTIEVADDGPGVDEALRPRLFEPFVTTRPQGTGLGLAIAAKLARAQRGDLAYLQHAGLGPDRRGARFRLTLSGTAS